jgi:hypothetical protein
MVHVSRLIARELKLPGHLLAWERLRLFLCHADEGDPVLLAALLPDLVGDIVLPLFVVELIDRI